MIREFMESAEAFGAWEIHMSMPKTRAYRRAGTRKSIYGRTHPDFKVTQKRPNISGRYAPYGYQHRHTTKDGSASVTDQAREYVFQHQPDHDQQDYSDGDSVNASEQDDF